MLDRIRIHGFRAARDVSLAPGPLCVLVGEASSGKSTVLSAVWALLDAAAPVPALDDVSAGSGGRIHLEAEVGGRTIFLDANPPATVNLNREGAPPTLMRRRACATGRWWRGPRRGRRRRRRRRSAATPRTAASPSSQASRRSATPARAGSSS
ncbi:MAG TPA: DUF2813 domain-containing protein [Gaiellaceae bacterium]|nr:DUF2813 domain-containing protein [Gaiellaceae bacterium]